MRQIPVNTPPLALATLAGMIQGQVLPVRTAELDGPRRFCVAQTPTEHRCAESGALLR